MRISDWSSDVCSSDLFLEPLLQRLHDLVPVAERLDRLHLLGRQIFFGDGLQPFLRYVDGVLAIVGEQPLEDLVEHLVEAVEQALVLHIDGTREIIELRSEEHTSELQSLLRSSYAVL